MANEINLRADLKEDREIHSAGVLFAGDTGTKIKCTVTSGGQPVTLTGTVRGYVIRADGEMITITNGTISGNTVTITLTAACCEVEGDLRISIKIADVTVCALRGNVWKAWTAENA